MSNYMLMHKDVVCGDIEIDDATSKIVRYKDINKEYAPFLGNSTLENIQKWWQMRSIPANRETIKSLISHLEISSSEEYLAKNLALSLTDTYWIKPSDMGLSYKDINFFNLKFLNDGKIPYHNDTSYDPNASLGGQMDKYWDLSGNRFEAPMLIKESYKYFGQQSINEAFASLLHHLQKYSDIPYVTYGCEKNDVGGINCMCEAFTSKDVEFISAYEVISSVKMPNDISLYDGYINLCAEYGIDRDFMQKYMDYQTLMDFIISNTDRHLLNMGILRDANNLDFISPAPIFDNGNSMFYSDMEYYNRVGLLEREITSFYKTEEKMLSKVKDVNVVKTELLPTPDKVTMFYINCGISEERADIISHNYALKCEMLEDLQQGITISLYNEKQREKEDEYEM